MAMRDLAREDFSTKRPPRPNGGRSLSAKILRLAILIAIVLGIFYLLKSKLNFSSGGGSSVVLRDAPRNLTPVAVDQSQNITEGAVDLTTQTAVLKDVKYGGRASGIAKRSYGGGTYILSVDATLPDPKGNSYGVWLVSGDKVLLVDYMAGSSTSWTLRLKGQDKYSKYDGILVTLERTRDNKPEERVLEGSF